MVESGFPAVVRSEQTASDGVVWPKAQQTHWWTQFRSTLASDLSSVIFSKTFIVILGFTLINVGFSLALGSAALFGSSSFPVTYNVVEQVSASLLILPLALITYFTGVLVWRDRDSRFHEILGATPTPNSVFTASRWTSMLILLFSVLLLGVGIGVFYQWTQGFYRFQLGVYFQELIGITGMGLVFLMVVSFLAHTFAPNKYVGYALFVLFVIVPETRNVTMHAVQSIANKSDQPIERFYLNVTPDLDTQITIPRAKIEKDDERLMMRTYVIDPPMQPGETIEMEYTLKTKTRGIENQVSNTQVVQNGTFFNNAIAPSFGYDESRRIALPRRRKSYGLEPVDSLPELQRDCDANCKIHYISQDADWVSVETVISTSDDQIAVAPGSLVEEWKEGNRNYYRYRVDHPSLNFYSFISARYEVERGKVGDVDTEVYYHKDHAWNVPKMSKAIADTIEYCSREFGPYKHKQARIIEFPRIASFAQAFPGTMPYSESIGFIANLEKPDDIDMVTYIVAHEMGHQWWAHQVIGAKVQGATLLSETLAQYTALMVMRKTYGDDMMHKFFRYEMDRYLRSRGSEQLKERPLMNVELNQGYIHYQKGGLALYYLAEMIGEQRINAALKQIIDQYAYQGPPYPNAYALVDRLREQTPEELRYLITDLFEEITLFENKTIDAVAEKQADGRYLIRLKVECEKKKADAKGVEEVVPMNDFLEIGAYAKPESGKRYGKLLHRERVQLEGGKHELEFVVDELPYQAGVDPRNLLIDLVPADNLKKVTLR